MRPRVLERLHAHGLRSLQLQEVRSVDAKEEWLLVGIKDEEPSADEAKPDYMNGPCSAASSGFPRWCPKAVRRRQPVGLVYRSKCLQLSIDRRPTSPHQKRNISDSGRLPRSVLDSAAGSRRRTMSMLQTAGLCPFPRPPWSPFYASFFAILFRDHRLDPTSTPCMTSFCRTAYDIMACSMQGNLASLPVTSFPRPVRPLRHAEHRTRFRCARLRLLCICSSLLVCVSAFPASCPSHRMESRAAPRRSTRRPQRCRLGACFLVHSWLNARLGAFAMHPRSPRLISCSSDCETDAKTILKMFQSSIQNFWTIVERNFERPECRICVSSTLPVLGPGDTLCLRFPLILMCFDSRK